MNINDLISKGILSLRSATIDDVDSVVPFINRAYRGESSARGWTTESTILEGQRLDNDMAREIINRECCEILLLLLHVDKVNNNIDDNQKKFIDHASSYNNNENIFIIATVSPEQEGDSLHLNMLAIHPDLQCYGIGKFMINVVENKAIENNISKVLLTAISCRSELITYYERRGYKMNGNKFKFPAYDDPRYGLPKVEGLELHEMEKFV